MGLQQHWNGERSRIHNCYNGIGSWFYQALGGINTDEKNPGYKHVFIRPQLVDGISWVDVSKDTPYGELKSRWEKSDSLFTMDVQIPVGSTATVILPVTSKQVSVNGEVLGTSGNLEISSGNYQIRCEL